MICRCVEFLLEGYRELRGEEGEVLKEMTWDEAWVGLKGMAELKC